MTTRPTLADAYAHARREGVRAPLAFRRPAPALAALAVARERLADLAAAEEAHALARADLAAADALAAPFKAAGFGVHTLTPPDAAPAIKAADAARGKEKAAARRVRAARALCSRPSADYGAGTWQGGQVAPDGFARILNAPAVAAGSPPSRMATAMHGGREGCERPGRLFYWNGGGRGPDVFRDVRDAPDVIGREASQWHDNPHGESFRDGSGLVVGVVAQLRGRDGRACFVPGFRFCGHEDSGTFDCGDVYTADGREESDAEEARRDAARAADCLAAKAAERESEYQAAWGAGAAWADLAARVADLRREARDVLAERRAARVTGADGFPALCGAVRRAVSDILDSIREAREEMERLRDGEESPYYHAGDADARAAFCEAAGLDAFPDDSRTWRAVRALRTAKAGATA